MARAEGDTSDYINAQAFAAVTEIVDRGDIAYQKNDMETAVLEYQKARQEASSRILPTSFKEGVDERYAQALAQLGITEAVQGKVDIARPKIEEAFKLAPNAPGVKEAKKKIDDPVRINQAGTAAHAENVKKVSALLTKAYGFYDLGDFDNATSNFQAVLTIDPYNRAARRGMETVNKIKMDYGNVARDEARSQALADVAKQWELPVSPGETPQMADNEGVTPDVSVGTPRTLVSAQMNRMIIPRVNLEGVNIFEAVDFVRSQARRLDPQGNGINIVTDIGMVGSPSFQAISDKRFNVQLNNVPVSEALRNIAEMSDTQVRQGDGIVRLTTNSEDAASMVSRTFQIPPGFFAGAGSDSEASSDPFSSGKSGGSLTLTKVNPKAFFEKSGVKFPEGSSISYNAANSSMIVRNTSSNLNHIEDIVSSAGESLPAQIIITATFMEVNMVKLKELGFDWIVGFSALGGNQGRLLGGGTDPSGTFFYGAPTDPSGHPHQAGLMTAGLRSGEQVYRPDSIDSLIAAGVTRTTDSSQGRRAPGILSARFIFNNADIEVIMRGLDQSKGVDVLQRPQVVARSGEKASFSFIREFPYPTEYTEPQIPSSMGQSADNNDYNGNNSQYGSAGGFASFPVTPSHPTGFNTRPVGVTMEVEPIGLSEDKNLVDLRLVPQLSEFDGFVNYGNPIMSSAVTSASPTGIGTVVLSQNQILMPVFTKRGVDTTVTVASGHTIVLGGLMKAKKEAFSDKVPIFGDIPLVGRLFRSEGERTEQKAIIIMVRADVVDPSGQKISTLPQVRAGE